MLIQINGGPWFNPAHVTTVGRSDDDAYRVEVTTSVGVMYRSGPLGSVEAAEALRDHIAEQVNRALYKPEGTP